MKIPKLIVGLDFETFYDSKGKYSLRTKKSKTVPMDMSMSEYVRDERFKAHCVGIQTNRQRKPRWYRHEEIPEALAQFDWKTTGLLAHNAAFDGLILSHHYGIVPAYYCDTLSMARLVHGPHITNDLDAVAQFYGYAGKVRAGALKAVDGVRDLEEKLLRPLGEYCADDVFDMWNIYKEMRPNVPEKEMHLIDLTIRAFADPVLEVDEELAREELERETKKKQRLIKSCSTLVGRSKYEEIEKVLSSPVGFKFALEYQGVQVPMKSSPTPGKEPIPAFAKNDLAFQALQKHPNKDVRRLCEARLAIKSTLGETRARRLLLRGQNGMKLPIMMNYAKAHTLRWSGGDKFNPQNLPARGGNTSLRNAIKAPKGYKMVVVDSSQIEARVNAWLAGQDDLVQLFATGGDPYKELASTIYDMPVSKIGKTSRERFVGKTGVLGLGYQMGATKYQLTLESGALGPPMKISEEEAKRIVEKFRSKNRAIVNQWYTFQNMLNKMIMGKEETYKDILHFHSEGVDIIPCGVTLHYPGLEAYYNKYSGDYEDFTYQSSPTGRSKIYGGLFVENVVQCLARMVVAEQALKIAEKYRVVLLVHDEVVFLAKTKDAKKALKFGINALSTAPDWCKGLPVAAEGGIHDTYVK